LRIYYAHRLSQFFHNNLNRCQQIRITGHNDCTLETISVCIQKKMGCQVDIRTLFFCFHYLDQRRQSRDRICERHFNDMSEEMPIKYVQIRQCFQSSKVCFLAKRLIGILRSRVYQRGVIFNSDDLIPGKQDFRQRLQVEPFIWSSPNGSKIQIEGIDV